MQKLIIATFILFLVAGCKKKNTCANSMKITATSTTPTIGDNITLTATRETDNEVYQWNGPKLNQITGSNTVDINNIKLSQRGLYRCNKGNADCNTSLNDSIFIDVKLKQETPPCSLTNNFVSCSNIPNVTFTQITKSFDGSFNAISLYAYGGLGYPIFKILFNSYNGNVEPLDGTYITSNTQGFVSTQEPNEISVSFNYSSNFYHCQAGQKVYVTHVGNKLQISFCNLICGGSPQPPTTCTGRMTEQ